MSYSSCKSAVFERAVGSSADTGRTQAAPAALRRRPAAFTRTGELAAAAAENGRLPALGFLSSRRSMSELLSETVSLPTLLRKHEVASYRRCSLRQVDRLIAAGELEAEGGGGRGAGPVLVTAASVLRLGERRRAEHAARLATRGAPAALRQERLQPAAAALPFGPLRPDQGEAG